MKSPVCCFCLLVLVVVPTSALPATWLVKWDGTGDAPTIQAGIDSSVTGDTVLVATGTYRGPGNFDLSFNGKAITVISQAGPHKTIIDCEDNGRGVVFNNGEGTSSVFSGFTISNGQTVDQGGGILCDDSSPQITDNLITGNTAGMGGGVCLKKSAAIVRNNTISENSSGIVVQGRSTPTISNNIICFSLNGQGIRCIGGWAEPTLYCNDIFGNAGGDGICGIDGGGNILVDPQFCGVQGSGNCYLQEDSPCAPAGSPCGALIGAMPVLCATTPVERKTWGSMKAIYH